jgi:hypothetical protein
MMLVAGDGKIMGRFKIGGWLYSLGWATAVVMGLAALAMMANL